MFPGKAQVEPECSQEDREKQGRDIVPFGWDSRGLHQVPRPGRRNYTSDCPPWCLITRGKKEDEGDRVQRNQHQTITRDGLETSKRQLGRKKPNKRGGEPSEEDEVINNN